MVLTPIITAFIIFSRLIITILYTPDFLAIETFISLGIIGMIFRAVSWCMAFVVLAKGEGKIFFTTETISTIVFLTSYISLFNLFAVDGFGMAFILWYFIYTLIIGYIYYRRFKLSLKPSCYKWILWSVLCTSTAFTAITMGYMWIAVIILIIATTYSLLQFKNMMTRHK